MKVNINWNALKTLLMVSVLLFAAVGTGVAANWDDETTNTTTTSDVTAEEETLNWYTDNESETYWFEVMDDTETEELSGDLELRFSNGADSINSTYYVNDTPEETDEENGHYAWEISHTELADELPRSIDGGTYLVEVVDLEQGETVEESLVTLSEQGDSPAVIRYVGADSEEGAIGNGLVADTLEIETNEAGLFASLFGADDKDVATFRDDVAVENETEITYRLEGQAADSMSAAADGYDDGDWIAPAQFIVHSSAFDTEYAQVYLNEAPDSADGTYVVYDDSADELTVHGDWDDANSISVRSITGERYSFGVVESNFGLVSAMENLLGSLNPF